MKQSPEQFRNDFEQEFGKLTITKLWLLVKFAKYVRLRCRNNSAFNNFCNAVFPHAHFKQVEKKRNDGTSYPGLSITINGTESIESEEE